MTNVAREFVWPACLALRGACRAIALTGLVASLSVVTAIHGQSPPTPPPCDQHPPPFTCADPHPSACDPPSVEFLGTSAGDDNIYVDPFTQDEFIYVYWKVHSQCGTCIAAFGPTHDLEIDGGAGGYIGLNIFGGTGVSGDTITSRVRKSDFSNLGLTCKHTIRIRAQVREVGGDCSINPGFVWKVSSSATVWVNNYWTTWPDDMAHCSGPPPACLQPTAGHPVDLASGTMFHEMVDLRIDGPLPIEFSRRYDSGSESVSGPLGYGWQHSGMIRLTDLSAAQAHTLVDHTNRKIGFSCSNGFRDHVGEPDTCFGPWYEDSVSHLKLTEGGGSSAWQVTDKQKKVLSFDSAGRLIGVADRNGNSLTYHYNSSHHLDTITDSYGRVMSIGYENGKVYTVSAGSGAGSRTVHYQYCGDDLDKVTFPDNSYVSYIYTSGSHRLEEVRDAMDQLIEKHTYTGDRVTRTESDAGNYLYDIEYLTGTPALTKVENNRAPRVETEFTIDASKGVATLRTGGPGCNACGDDGNANQKLYDDNLNVTDTVDGLGICTHMTYDSMGDVLSRKEGGVWTTDPPSCNPPYGRTTTYEYNAFSLPTIISVPTVGSGDCAEANPYKVTTNEYSILGNLEETTVVGCDGDVAFSNITKYAYDEKSASNPGGRGQLIKFDGPRNNLTDVEDVTSYEYYPNTEGAIADRGRLKRVTNALDQHTDYADYDLFGNVGKVTDPNGVVTTYTYDGRDRVLEISVQQPGSSDVFTTTYEYDLGGRLHRVRSPECVAEGTSCEYTVQYGYDGVNRLTEIDDAVGNKIFYSYDAEGNLTHEVHEDANLTVQVFNSFRYDNFNRMIRHCIAPSSYSSCTVYAEYDYYADGMLHTETDPQGHTTTLTYDNLKRLKSSAQTIGTERLTTAYEYNLQDGLIKITDPRDLETIYANDDLGRRRSTASPDTGTTLYDYDEAGNLTRTTDANDVIIDRAYDALNRLTTITYPNDAIPVTYSYDSENVAFGKGRRTGMTDASGESVFGYDPRGLLTSEHKTLDGTTYFTGYSYDKSGNLTEVQYPESPATARGGFVKYGYDDAERVSLVTVDLKGEATTIADSFQYKAFGPRTHMRLANDLVDARSYDARYQLQSWTVGSAPNYLLDYDRTFNSDGNLTTQVDKLNHSNDRTFGYDALHRLITASGPWGLGQAGGIATYTYDNNGNRLSKGETQPATSYTHFSGTNRLETETTGSTVTNYSYTLTGNITADGAHTYRYNDADRLVTVDENTSTSLTYTYDGDNRRVMKTQGASTTYYFYDPAGRLLTELHPGTGAVKGKDYLYLHDAPIGRVGWLVTAVPGDYGGEGVVLGIGGAEQPVQYVADKALLYYHTDQLGTPIAMTDENAEFVWKAEYRPFGEVEVSSASTTKNNLRFPGQYFDEETGLHQNWFRDYDPKTGRYREADPIGLYAGSNPYGYAESNPILGQDPFGLCSTLTGGTSVAGYDPCKDPRMKFKVDFLRANLADAQLLASLNATRPEFLLAQSADESTYGQTALATQGGNYFGSQYGSFFANYRIGAYINPLDGRPYNRYGLQNGFLDSGASLLLGFHGKRIYGTQTIGAYVRALTTTPYAFNSKPWYPTAINSLYREVMQLLPCVATP